MTMFRGHSYRSLDAKGRLMLTPEFREIITRHSPDGKLVLTKFLDGCVAGYPMPVWEDIERKMIGMDAVRPDQRALQRFIISAAETVTLDKQGRILVPPHLREFAELDKDVALAGVGRRFEIWNMETFEAKRVDTEENLTQLIEGMAGMDLGLNL